MSSIDDICNVTGCNVSEDVISSWRFHRDMCINIEFNIPWFVEVFSKVEKLLAETVEGPSVDMVKQQEAEVEKFSEKLKLKRADLQSTKEAFAKNKKPLLKNFP